MIVAPRKQIAKNIEAYGYNSSNCVIVGQESGFINAELFDYWAESVLFPEIERKRILLNYKGDAILMLDGCTSHFSDFFQDECTYNGVYPFQDPPGTSDQVQALDLGIFSIQKTIKKNLRPPKQIKGEMEREIVCIVDSWKQATLSRNVVSAFNQAGIYLEHANGKVIMRANIKYARAVRGIEHEETPKCEVYETNQKLKQF